MGCGASTSGPGSATMPSGSSTTLPAGSSASQAELRAKVWQHPGGKPLSTWTEEDVDDWFASLPVKGLQACRETLLVCTDGKEAAAWTLELVQQAGLTGLQATHLLAFRNKAMKLIEGGPSDDASPSAAPSKASSSSRGPLKGAASPFSALAEQSSSSNGGKANASQGGEGNQKYVDMAIDGLQKLLDTVGPMIPFPGAAGVVSALSTLLGMVKSSMANKANLEALRDRCLDLLQVIAANREALQGKGQAIISNFGDILTDILAYAEEYSSRNWLMRLVQSSGDGAHYDDLLDRLKELVRDATFNITADVSSKVSSVLQRLKDMPPYVDLGAPARLMVERAGGVEAVMADPALRAQLLKLVDPGQQVNALLTQQAVSLLEAAAEEGAHRPIKQTDLRIFWRKNFKTQYEVKWPIFWSFFPDELEENPMAAKSLAAIQEALNTPEEKAAFESNVGSNTDTVTVADIKLLFPADAELVSTVQHLSEAGMPGRMSRAASMMHPQAQAAQEEHSTKPAAPAMVNKLFRLPLPDTMYGGRDEDAQDIMASLQERAVCLVATAGYGKSSLALDVGARLWAAGVIPGGAYFVDLREARKAEDVLGRFCAALDVNSDGALLELIECKLRQLAAADSMGISTRPLLLLVDNAEDPLRAEGAACFESLLSKVATMHSGVRLLVTSRQKLTLPAEIAMNVNVAGIRDAAAVQLVLEVAAELCAGDAEIVAQLCGCVPLLLRLVAGALAGGRMVMQDLDRLLLHPAGDSGDAATISIMLESLPRRQQQQMVQLSVFPSLFDDDAAAAVMKMDAYQAHSAMQVLYKHGLVLFNSASRGWTLHMAVKCASAQLADTLGQGRSVLLDAQHQLVRHTMCSIRQWADMYFNSGAAAKLALLLARKQLADVAATFGILADARPLPNDLAEEVAAVGSYNTFSAFCCFYLLLWKDDNYCATWRKLSSAMQSQGKVALQADALFCLGYSLRVRPNKPDKAEGLAAAELCVTLRTDIGMAHTAVMATTLNLQGGCLRFQGRSAEAEPLHRRALVLHKELLGPDHYDVGQTLCNTSNCLIDLGRHAEAEVMIREALAVFTKHFGLEHAQIGNCRLPLAECLLAQGHYAEAKDMFLSAIDVLSRILGPEHVFTLKATVGLEKCMRLHPDDAAS